MQGYFKNGLTLLNLIHVKDIIAIVEYSLSGDLLTSFRGERFIVSSGAYRISDLAEAANIKSPPQAFPLDTNSKLLDTFKKSKILSMAKLIQVVGVHYSFLPPLPGVQPTSQGLPSEMLPLAEQPPNPELYDCLWELFIKYHAGKWEGNTHTYTCVDDSFGGKLTKPTLFKNACSSFYVLDHDNILQHETTPLFPAGVEMKLSRKTFNKNSHKKFFGFPGVTVFASQGYQAYMECEVNFFYKQTRSVLHHFWSHSEDSGNFKLSIVTVSAFHCGFSDKDSIPKQINSIPKLIEDVQSFKSKQTYSSLSKSPVDGAGEVQENVAPTHAVSIFLEPQPDCVMKSSFPSNLIASIPVVVSKGAGYKIVVGCKHSSELFQVCTVSYDERGVPSSCSMEEYFDS